MVKQLLELGKTLVVAVIIAALIIVFIFETVSVDGTSMYSTLHNNDRLIVEKVSYYFRKPKQGDIIVFKYPSDVKKKFIKRVIAVSGDKVKISNDEVYVNDKKLNEPYAYFMKTDNEDIEDYRIHSLDETVVPKGTVFVLGDNRYNSLDSRFEEVGFVDTKLIIGRAVLRIYPFNKLGRVR